MAGDDGMHRGPDERPTVIRLFDRFADAAADDAVPALMDLGRRFEDARVLHDEADPEVDEVDDHGNPQAQG